VAWINSLAGRVQQNSGILIFVPYEGPVGDPHHPSQPGWNVLPEQEVLPDDRVMAKTVCDSFLDTELDDILKANHIAEQIITGYATNFCGDCTVRPALGRGYATIAPEDGHTTADRAGFIVPACSARVCPYAEIIL